MIGRVGILSTWTAGTVAVEVLIGTTAIMLLAL
jgi:hypothetical protein